MDGDKKILLISVGTRGGEGGEVDIRDAADLLNTIWDWLESTEEELWDGQRTAKRERPRTTATTPQCQMFV